MALSTSTVASQRDMERLLNMNHIWILFAKACYCQNLCEVNTCSYRQTKIWAGGSRKGAQLIHCCVCVSVRNRSQ